MNEGLVIVELTHRPQRIAHSDLMEQGGVSHNICLVRDKSTLKFSKWGQSRQGLSSELEASEGGGSPPFYQHKPPIHSFFFLGSAWHSNVKICSDHVHCVGSPAILGRNKMAA